jgi:hypothetical protein
VRLRNAGGGRILDFDIETRAAGYADPEWVPDDVTCYAWSWIGTDKLRGKCPGRMRASARTLKQREWLRPLRDLICAADILTGHNITRFDLRVLNANFMRFGLDPLPRFGCRTRSGCRKRRASRRGRTISASCSASRYTSCL